MTVDEVTITMYRSLPATERAKASDYIKELFASYHRFSSETFPRLSRDQIIKEVKQSHAQAKDGKTTPVRVAREELRELYGI